MAQQTQMVTDTFTDMSKEFKVGDKVTAILHASYGESSKQSKEGVVIYANPYFITVDFDCFNESFSAMEYKASMVKKKDN